MIRKVLDKPVEEKQFEGWMAIKEELHSNAKVFKISEGDIWWCSIGENVGVEINGKSNLFSRPVLVLKKLSRFGFLGVPLTSQFHEGSWYVEFKFEEKMEIAVLAQVRVFSVARLHSRIGTVSDSDLKMVKDGFYRLYVE